MGSPTLYQQRCLLDLRLAHVLVVRMPFCLRYLRGSRQYLLDPKSIPADHVLLNPSVAGDIVYIRDIMQTSSRQINSIILYNTATKKSTQIPMPVKFLQPTEGYYLGLEDLRILWFNECLYFTATCTHASPRMQSEMVLGYFNKDLTEIEKLWHIDFGAPPVKNICPFIHRGEIMLVDTYMRKLYKVSFDEEGPQVSTLVERMPGQSLDIFGDSKGGLRGTTSPVQLHGDVYGCLVHDIIYDENIVLNTTRKLVYLHQWVEFDASSGAIVFASSPFSLVHVGVEFASGIDYDRQSNKVTIHAGVDDKIPMVITTTLTDLRV